MITLTCWQPLGEPFTITAVSEGLALDIAANNGATRAVNGLGETYRRLLGEWVAMPYVEVLTLIDGKRLVSLPIRRPR